MSKTKPRILCISRAYGENAGGMERLSFEFISELKKSSVCEVTSLVHETKQGRSLLATRIASVLFVLGVLPRAILQSRNVDIVHIGDPVLSFIGWCIRAVRKVPIAVTVHGLDVSYTSNVYQLYLTLFFRSFDAYIAISEHAKELLNKKRVSGKVVVIPPGIRDVFYDNSKTRNDIGRMLRKNIAGRYILATTGRLVLRKGHAWFIQNVIPRLPKNVLYVIAGSGPEYTPISHLIRSLKLSDRVLMLGRISHEDQAILLNTIDAFIQPNILVPGDNEGFGIAPLEAALCGKPVFASNVDGIPSAIHHGKNGTLLPSKETTAWVNTLAIHMQNPSPLPDSRGYTLATFQWSTIIKRYESVLLDAIR